MNLRNWIFNILEEKDFFTIIFGFNSSNVSRQVKYGRLRSISKFKNPYDTYLFNKCKNTHTKMTASQAYIRKKVLHFF